jgi:hypothetical protein
MLIGEQLDNKVSWEAHGTLGGVLGTLSNQLASPAGVTPVTAARNALSVGRSLTGKTTTGTQLYYLRARFDSVACTIIVDSNVARCHL